jgi:hypothetical protein
VGSSWVLESEFQIPSTSIILNNTINVSIDELANTVVIGDQTTEHVWVFIRQFDFVGQSTGWSRYEITAPDAIGNASFGHSVKISSNGNTIVIGGPNDNGGDGAIWVYQKNMSGLYVYQAKLTGTLVLNRGFSVDISSSGDTIIAGVVNDNAGVGGALIFYYNGAVWAQQAALIGTGYSGAPNQGAAVSISSDGNTAAVGGPDDNGGDGAVWVYTRSGVSWTQQGSKITSGNSGEKFGYSVAISYHSNNMIVGAPQYITSDGLKLGKAYIYNRSAGVWTQKRYFLPTAYSINTIPISGEFGKVNMGTAVAFSGNGIAFAGGPSDQDLTGATWVFS